MLLKRPRLPLISALLCALVLLASCGSSRPSMTAHRSGHRTQRESAPSAATFVIPSTADEPTRRLLSEARSWLGTSYRYGGEDFDGVDCSGFVMNVFNRSLSIKLPRNSAKQEEYCNKIDRSQLTAGDLLFFTTRGSEGVGHVGIYIGDGQMIHSSSSRGVIISSIDQPYYLDNYYSSGRVEKFYAMRSVAPSSAPAVPQNPAAVSKTLELMANAEKPAAKSASKPTTQHAVAKPRTVRLSHTAPRPATAAAMESDRQKALDALLNQIEDSIFAVK